MVHAPTICKATVSKWGSDAPRFLSQGKDGQRKCNHFSFWVGLFFKKRTVSTGAGEKQPGQKEGESGPLVTLLFLEIGGSHTSSRTQLEASLASCY